MSKKISRIQKYQTLGGRDTLKAMSNRKKFFYFFIVAKLRSDETRSIFNFKKGEIMKHPIVQYNAAIAASMHPVIRKSLFLVILKISEELPYISQGWLESRLHNLNKALSVCLISTIGGHKSVNNEANFFIKSLIRLKIFLS